MTIHPEHPFHSLPDQRDPVRQLRGRLPAPVTIVTTGTGSDWIGLTVSSMLIVNGEPASVVLMVDPDSDLSAVLAVGVAVAMSVLTEHDGSMAAAFAGLAPAPGGPFSVGTWTETEFGPIRTGVSWVGARVSSLAPLGWSVQVTARIERIELLDVPVLIHQRGDYRT